MQTKEIIGENYLGCWDKTRTACRGIIIRDGRILLSYETKTGQWMLPGGGLEDGEDERSCCVREVAEETGVIIQPTECRLEIDEYYEDWKWVNRYFFGTVAGQTEIRLTDREKEVGMEPRWLPVREIMDIFSKHASYADTDEMRRGMYLREYTALSVLLPDYIQGRKINDAATVKMQYGTADKLNTRISVHEKYSINKQGFGHWITAHYQIRNGMSVLELGCGTGDMWVGKQEMISRCSRFVLSDFSEGMLSKTQETLRDYEGIEYRIIDIQDIPFEDHTFDVVIANMMLYHVPDLSRGLREVRRVMKEDGVFYCATYGEKGMMEYICSLFEPYHVQNRVNHHFTLQNGEEKLRSCFSDIKKELYKDALAVTRVEDMVDYICSLTGMTDLQMIPRTEIRAVLEKNMHDGILHVPKEYGLFIARG